jgi:hypothetical protein
MYLRRRPARPSLGLQLLGQGGGDHLCRNWRGKHNSLLRGAGAGQPERGKERGNREREQLCKQGGRKGRRTGPGEGGGKREEEEKGGKEIHGRFWLRFKFNTGHTLHQQRFAPSRDETSSPPPLARRIYTRCSHRAAVPTWHVQVDDRVVTPAPGYDRHIHALLATRGRCRLVHTCAPFE